MKRTSYAASHPVLRVNTKRFAASPFLDRYANEEAVFGVYAGRLYPLSLGQDAEAMYWKLRRSAVLYDVPERPLEISGPDAERFLDRMLVRDVTAIRVGRAAYALACYSEGGILMDGVVMRLADDRFWWVLADGDVEGWLAAHAPEFDVSIRDPRSWVLQVQGPRSFDVLSAACDGTPPDPFTYFAVADVSLGGQRVLVSRTGWTGELGFEIYTREDTSGPALWDHLLAAGAPIGLSFAGLESMGIRRIEAGILDNGTDMDPSITPFQAGLGRFVDLGKADFVGKTALERADRRPLLFGIRCSSRTPAAGALALRGSDPVGRVTIGAWSPFLDSGIGYVRFDTPEEWVGTEVDIGGAHAEVVGLPFYDPDKRIPRGLDVAVP